MIINIPVFFIQADPEGLYFGQYIGQRVLDLNFFAAEQGDDRVGIGRNVFYHVNIQH
jgi:hypothetical protein